MDKGRSKRDFGGKFNPTDDIPFSAISQRHSTKNYTTKNKESLINMNVIFL